MLCRLTLNAYRMNDRLKEEQVAGGKKQGAKYRTLEKLKPERIRRSQKKRSRQEEQENQN